MLGVFLQVEDVNSGCSVFALFLKGLPRDSMPGIALAGGGVYSKIAWLVRHRAPQEAQYKQPGGFCWDSGQRTLKPGAWSCIQADIQGYPANMQYAVVFLAGKSMDHRHEQSRWCWCGPKFAPPKLCWKL